MARQLNVGDLFPQLWCRGFTSWSGGGENRTRDAGRETGLDVLRVRWDLLDERPRHQGANQSSSRPGPRPGIQHGSTSPSMRAMLRSSRSSTRGRMSRSSFQTRAR